MTLVKLLELFNLILNYAFFHFFSSKLPAVKLLLPGLVREDY